MYKVINRNGSVFGTEPCSCEFVCDTTDDVSTLPTSIAEGTGGKTKYDDQVCGSGSIAVVVDNGTNPKRYILDNQDVWCPQSLDGTNINQDLSEYAKKTDLDSKADATHTHSASDIGADTRGSAAAALSEAKTYTDNAVADLINGAPTTRDTLKEISDLMDENASVVEALDAAIGTKANKTDIPTKTSELENDSGFLSEHQDLSEYAKKTDIPTELPANGGNADIADTVNNLRTNAVYYNIFSTTLDSTNPCWNKKCYVAGNSVDSSYADYIENAPEKNSSALWYEVETIGTSGRAYQIAHGVFGGQRKSFIRYMQDGVWSEWKNVADGGNADTVDGLHANDFVRSFNGPEMSNNRIQIPNDVHVGNWLAANARVGIQYFIHSLCTGLTGLPNENVDWTWFVFNGVEYFAKTIDDRIFYMNHVNSYSGWSEIYTSKSKPYVTGTTSYKISSGSITTWNVTLDFTPSVVIYQSKEGVFFAGIIENGFYVSDGGNNGSGERTAKYIAFK